MARIGEQLEKTSGPELIPALWRAYAELPELVRERVLERGDRDTSPPRCLADSRGEDAGGGWV